MFEVKVLSDFSSAHYLRNYQGKCENCHGHNWKVEVICRGETLDEAGLLIDFKVVKQKVNDLLDELDHCELNDLPYFKEHNPSSECIAYYIYTRVSEDEEIAKRVSVHRVNVWENDRSCASYIADAK